MLLDLDVRCYSLTCEISYVKTIAPSSAGLPTIPPQLPVVPESPEQTVRQTETQPPMSLLQSA